MLTAFSNGTIWCYPVRDVIIMLKGTTITRATVMNPGKDQISTHLAECGFDLPPFSPTVLSDCSRIFLPFHRLLEKCQTSHTHNIYPLC